MPNSEFPVPTKLPWSIRQQAHLFFFRQVIAGTPYIAFRRFRPIHCCFTTHAAHSHKDRLFVSRLLLLGLANRAGCQHHIRHRKPAKRLDHVVDSLNDLFRSGVPRIVPQRSEAWLFMHHNNLAWDPAHHEADRQSRDALAARGYWQAFQKVKGTVSKVLAGENPGAIARADHKEWYRELFESCVVSGLIPTSALAGYRIDAVYVRNSRHVPPRWEAVRDAMPALFDLIEAEPEPSVRAVLGHWLFGYIHPYSDGNGRMARFLMNVLLASGGYPWTVVRVEDRTEYLKALDRASIDVNARPFASFIAERVRWSFKKTKRSLGS